MKEKRRYRRLEQEMPVRHHVEKEEVIENTKAADISAGGIRIATQAKLDIGTKLNIEMHIPQSELPYYAVGEVVWLKENEGRPAKKFDLGVRFLRIVSKAQLKGF